MIKIFFIIGISFLFLNGFAVNALNEKSSEETLILERINFSYPSIQENDQYVSVNLNEETSQFMESGKSVLPIVSKVFILPFGSKVCNVQVQFSEWHEIQLSKDVQLAPEIVPLKYEDPLKMEVKDVVVYDNNRLYPDIDFSYAVGVGLKGEEHVVYLAVHCYPIKYSSAQNLIFYSECADIRVIYDEPLIYTSYPDEYDLVIISPERFSSKLQPLIDHKNNYDIRTVLKTTEDIYSEYIGRDNAEQIKYFIKDAIERWNIEYVLIIGGIDIVPIRMTAVRWLGVFNQLPTDLYYADVYDESFDFCSWDSNNNDIFGEYYFDTDMAIDYVDLYPDINIGRLPCRTNREVSVVVNKIITYETWTYSQEWFNRLILMGGDTFPRWGVYEGEVTTYHIEQVMQGFESIKLWASQNRYNPILINREITKGAGFVSYSGHGYVNGFGTSPPHDLERIEYYLPYTIGMLNINKYPVIFFDACSTAEIDYEYYGIKIPCFAWYLVIKPFGGAVATIGSTRVAYAWTNEWGPQRGCARLNLDFFRNFEPGCKLSHMLTSAKNDYINYIFKDYVTLEQFILIGDPSLKIGGYP